MPGITELADLLSLDIVAALVQAGYRAPWRPGVATLPVLGATNATPIVVTLDTSLLGDRGFDMQPGAPMHLVLADIGGNTAANKLDPTDLRNEAWHAEVVDGSRVALYDLDENTGEKIASVGSGAYTSGGTCSRAFTDGRIQVGEEHLYEQMAPPRVVFVPRRSTFEAKLVTNARTIASLLEQQREEASRSVRTEIVVYEVHVWGGLIEEADDPRLGFNLAQAIYQQIFRSAEARCAGVNQADSGDWADQRADATQIVKRGREFVFELGLRTPIPERALPRAPSGVTFEIPTTMELPDATTEEGCP